MDDPDAIDTAPLIPKAHPQHRRVQARSRTVSETEPTTLINRNRVAFEQAETVIAPVRNQNAPPYDENAIEYEGNCCTDPRSFGHRMMALVLMCLLGFGSYFCFDNPGALQKEIKEAMGISTYQFANLYAWYNWPNVILPIVGGYLMDSVFGIRLGTIIFAAFIIIGMFDFFGENDFI